MWQPPFSLAMCGVVECSLAVSYLYLLLLFLFLPRRKFRPADSPALISSWKGSTNAPRAIRTGRLCRTTSVSSVIRKSKSLWTQREESMHMWPTKGVLIAIAITTARIFKSCCLTPRSLIIGSRPDFRWMGSMPASFAIPAIRGVTSPHQK